MICPNCNTNNEPDSKFCMICGSKLEESVPVQPFADESSGRQTEPSQEFPAQSVAPEDFEVAYIPTSPEPVLYSPPPADPPQGELSQAASPQTMPPAAQLPLGEFVTYVPPREGEFVSVPSPAAFDTGQTVPPGFQQAPIPPTYQAPSPVYQPQPYPAYQAPPKKKKTALWIALGVLGGLLVLCLVLYFAFLRPYIKGALSGGDMITAENLQKTEQIKRIGEGKGMSASYSPDARYFAVATTIGIDVFDANTREKEQHLLDDQVVFDVAFAPNDELLASTYDGIYHYAADSFKLISMIEQNDLTYKMSLSNDGNVLATDNYDVVTIYKKSGQSYAYSREIINGEDYYSMGISPDGTKLATGNSEGVLKIWDINTGGLLDSIAAHADFINQLAWSPDSSLIATASDDGSVAIHYIATREEIFRYSFEDAEGTAVVFSADGTKLLTNGEQSEIVVWDLVTATRMNTFAWGDIFFRQLEINPTNTNLVALNKYGQTTLWDYYTGTQIDTLDEYNSTYFSLAISPNGSKYFYLDGNELSVMADETGKIVWSRVDEAFDQMLAPAFSKDGSVLVGGTYHGYVNFLNANNGTEINYFDAHDDWIREIAISPDESKIATASDDKTIKVWNYNTYELLYTLEGHTDYVRTVAFSPDGQLIASAGDDQTVRIWDVNTGIILHVLEGHEDWIFTVAFSPDGKILGSTGGDGYVLLWDPYSGEQIRKVDARTHTKYSLGFTNDGKTFFVEEGMDIQFYDIENGSMLMTLTGHTDNIIRARMSADGTTLVSTSFDGTVRVWRVK